MAASTFMTLPREIIILIVSKVYGDTHIRYEPPSQPGKRPSRKHPRTFMSLMLVNKTVSQIARSVFPLHATVHANFEHLSASKSGIGPDFWHHGDRVLSQFRGAAGSVFFVGKLLHYLTEVKKRCESEDACMLTKLETVTILMGCKTFEANAYDVIWRHLARVIDQARVLGLSFAVNLTAWHDFGIDSIYGHAFMKIVLMNDGRVSIREMNNVYRESAEAIQKRIAQLGFHLEIPRTDAGALFKVDKETKWLSDNYSNSNNSRRHILVQSRRYLGGLSLY